MLKIFIAEKETKKYGRLYGTIYDTEKMIEEINAYAKKNNLCIKQVVRFCDGEAVVLFEKAVYGFAIPNDSRDWMCRIEE